MARTVKAQAPNPYRKEEKAYRRTHNKSYRRSVRLALVADVECPRYRRTSGWLTW